MQNDTLVVLLENINRSINEVNSTLIVLGVIALLVVCFYGVVKALDD